MSALAPGCPHCGSAEAHPFIQCPSSLDYFAAGELQAPDIPREARLGDPEKPAEGKGISAASLLLAAEKLAGPIWGLAKTGNSRFKEGHVVWSADLARQLIRCGELDPPEEMAHYIVFEACRLLEIRGLIYIVNVAKDGTFTFRLTKSGAALRRVE